MTILTPLRQIGKFLDDGFEDELESLPDDEAERLREEASFYYRARIFFSSIAERAKQASRYLSSLSFRILPY